LPHMAAGNPFRLFRPSSRLTVPFVLLMFHSF